MLELLDKKDFDEVYAIMEKSFPETEFRPREEQYALFSDSAYRIFVCRREGKIAGFFAVWDFPDVLYIEHFAVDGRLRGSGLGASMLGELKAISEKPVCFEVELPETDIARRRIGFYERNGFFLNPYPYMQPPISAGRDAIPLLIMTGDGCIDETKFEKIKQLLYTRVYKYTTV